jgi:hypothetical protein
MDKIAKEKAMIKSNKQIKTKILSDDDSEVDFSIKHKIGPKSMMHLKNRTVKTSKGSSDSEQDNKKSISGKKFRMISKYILQGQYIY